MRQFKLLKPFFFFKGKAFLPPLEILWLPLASSPEGDAARQAACRFQPWQKHCLAKKPLLTSPRALWLSRQGVEWLLACLDPHSCQQDVLALGCSPLQLWPSSLLRVFGTRLKKKIFPKEPKLPRVLPVMCHAVTQACINSNFTWHCCVPSEAGGLGTCQASWVLTQKVLHRHPRALNF